MAEAGRRRLLPAIVAALAGALAVSDMVGVVVALQLAEQAAAVPEPPLPSAVARVPSPTPAGPTPAPPAPTPTTPTPAVEWAPTLTSGPWPTSHVQGIAVDLDRGFIYYSFTTLLVKTDHSGEVLGTVSGFTGHLGDLDFNPADGRVYGSLEYKEAEAFYIAIFDVDRIDRIGMDAQDSSVVSTVYLPEVVDDFTADLDGNGVFAGDRPDTRDHRYGSSGIDGVAFGPAFGSADGPLYLTVAYGIYANKHRSDNDYQVLLQYDIGDWPGFERPLTETGSLRDGPTTLAGKYFVLTGNTHFGVQSLEYDPWQERWFLSVYPGTKRAFPNFSLFAVDATTPPRQQALAGSEGERAAVLSLAEDGLLHEATGIRGWQRELPFGMQAVDDGLYYLVESQSARRSSSATLTLEEWTGKPEQPFRPAER